MYANLRNFLKREDGARQFALQCTLVTYLFQELRHSKVSLVKDLKSNLPALRKSFTGELDAELIKPGGGDPDTSARVCELVGNLQVLQPVDNGTGLFGIEVRIEGLIVFLIHEIDHEQFPHENSDS